MPKPELELRTVKLIVGFMTALLVVMGGAVVWKLSQPLTPTQPVTTAPLWEYSLPEGQIESIAQSGTFLAILVKTPDGQKIQLFNPVTRTIVGTIKSAP